MSKELKVSEACLKGLRLLKELGLLSADKEELCSEWPESNVQFDADGYLIFLNLGSKRLYKGLSCPQAFGYFCRLQTLNLGGTDLPISDMEKVLKEITDSIECLYLGGNGLRDEGVKAVSTWMQSSSPTKLKKLDLRYNDIGSEGMQALCEGLKDSNVVFLYMEGNQLGDEGVRALADLLKEESCKLLEVYLGANRVEAKGAAQLASSLKTNKRVSKIYLESNNIGVEGADAFREVLEEGKGESSLKNLYVDDNNIGKAGSKRLAAALNSGAVIGNLLDE